ncbi:MAG TPA: MipA/OmpV family protein, partial [Sphingomicrobium sp.]|nr:MipA/OmpV family protein [Sphingomicrobium sp.]
FVGVSKTGVITSDYDTLSARISYVHDVAGAHGSYVVQPSIDYGTPLSTKAFIGASVSANIVGRGYARYYFDVTPAGALASGLPVYTTDEGGLKDVNVTLLGMHSLTGDLRHGLAAVAVASYGRMVGDFRRSPLVAVAGDRNQWLGGLGLAYSF